MSREALTQDAEKRRRSAKWLALALLCANVLIWAIAFSATGRLQVTFLNVGQGNAIFIQTPQGRQILIDGGPGRTVLDKLGQTMPFWDKDIDMVILTHPDRDHLAGLLAVLGAYRVKKILWSGIAGDSAEDQEWIAAVGREQADVETPRGGEKFQFDGNPANFIQILSSAAVADPRSKNENSLVALLVFGQRSFLFTGDITREEGDRLARDYPGLGVDILQVAHHGSKYSTGGYFLASLLPAAAVISVGRNSYGHPAPEVLELLTEYDIKTLRTDQSGDVAFETDGEHLFVKTEK